MIEWEVIAGVLGELVLTIEKNVEHFCEIIEIKYILCNNLIPIINNENIFIFNNHIYFLCSRWTIEVFTLLE